ncbi:hypothetical protein MUK42_01789 [Musa troglodytarum]|uniref:GLTSCR protein conserved domain-containing protein n=1 Tax=Musa troglodytarum TaxID=320322 RepID=A0A9E7JTT8_9LILI|nr:hypothetical protein MUK42_01789 [Musa troglodytarum]
MAHQDALMVCNPDYKSPFASVEDAVHRLLPYHVVSDYNAEEDDRVLESDTTGDITSRSQQWDNDALDAVTKFNATFEKQVRNFNMMLRKRAQGEFRSEERLMLENALMQEEKEALLKTKLEIESREKADKEAAEAQMRMAMSQGEQAQAELRSHANVYAASLRYEGMATWEVPWMDFMGGIIQREMKSHQRILLSDENEPEWKHWRQAGKEGDCHLDTLKHDPQSTTSLPALSKKKQEMQDVKIVSLTTWRSVEQHGMLREGIKEAWTQSLFMERKEMASRRDSILWENFPRALKRRTRLHPLYEEEEEEDIKYNKSVSFPSASLAVDLSADDRKVLGSHPGVLEPDRSAFAIGRPPPTMHRSSSTGLMARRLTGSTLLRP